MNTTKKTVAYSSTNSYETLNDLTNETKNVWVVLHGIGYLSKYFLRHFKNLDPNENYIIAPQAPSKYYLNNEYKYVGASWLTKEDTQTEIANVLNYIDAVFTSENITTDKKMIVFGFSQGVSIATRWIAHSKLIFDSLILYAGSIPDELTKDSFDHIDFKNASVELIYGDTDAYITKKRLKYEKTKSELLFKGEARTTIFTGGHELKPELLKAFI